MTEPPLTFIIGVPRSGTTLAATLLNAHPAVHVDREAIALRLLALLDRRAARPLAPWPELVDQDERLARFLDLATHYDPELPFGRVVHRALVARAHAHGKAHFVDKSPDALPAAGRLLGLLPGSRLIWLRRDPRPTVLSLHRRQYLEWTEAALLWREWTGRGLALADWCPPERLLALNYEELVAEPERTAGRLCAFLGVVPAVEAMTNLGGNPITTKQDAYVLGRFATDKLTDWRGKISPVRLRTVEAICGPLLPALGYVPETDAVAALPGRRERWRRQVVHKARLVGVPERQRMIDRGLVTVRVPLYRRLGALAKAVLRGFLPEV